MNIFDPAFFLSRNVQELMGPLCKTKDIYHNTVYNSIDVNHLNVHKIMIITEKIHLYSCILYFNLKCYVNCIYT